MKSNEIKWNQMKSMDKNEQEWNSDSIHWTWVSHGVRSFFFYFGVLGSKEHKGHNVPDQVQPGE